MNRLDFPTRHEQLMVWSQCDGRFVMVDAVATEGETTRMPAIRITQNWYEEFRDREPD